MKLKLTTETLLLLAGGALLAVGITRKANENRIALANDTVTCINSSGGDMILSSAGPDLAAGAHWENPL